MEEKDEKKSSPCTCPPYPTVRTVKDGADALIAFFEAVAACPQTSALDAEQSRHMADFLRKYALRKPPQGQS